MKAINRMLIFYKLTQTSSEWNRTIRNKQCNATSSSLLGFLLEDWITVTRWYIQVHSRTLRQEGTHSKPLCFHSFRNGGQRAEKSRGTFVMRILYFSTRWSLLWHPASSCHTSPRSASGTPLRTSADSVLGRTLRFRCLQRGGLRYCTQQQQPTTNTRVEHHTWHTAELQGSPDVRVKFKSWKIN